ncbi:MAG: hypothetical protein ABI454_07960 [Sphingomicrobium sp.]
MADRERAGETERAGRFDLALLVGILLIPAVLGSSKTIFNDGDVSWHIATGQWILDHGAIPHTDPFSYTWAGRPWVPIEWLAELIYASAYRLAGYGGVAALVTAALMALHAIVFSNASRWTRPLLAIVLMDLVLIPTMLARPHVLAWPLLAAWTWLMLLAREKDRAPPLVAALLMTLWANLHGSFVFGLAVAGAFGLEAVVASSDRSRALRQWLIFGVACVVAVFVNATGIEGVFHPLRFANLKMLPLIDEWKPSDPRVTPVFFAVLVAVALLILWKRPRLHPVRWVLLGAFLFAALLQVRHQAMLGIIAAMILPQGFAKQIHQSSAGSSRMGRAVVAVGAALLLAVRTALPMSPPDNEANPWKLIAAVPPQLRSQPVLNGYSMGGPLILSGIRPYVDGRGDMYGDELVLGYARIARGDPQAFAEAVDRWDIRWAIIPNRSTELIALLDRSGWRRIARDRVGVIYVRKV